MNVITIEELLREYAAGKRNFAGIDLNIINTTGLKSIKNADLRHINLRGAFLIGIHIENTNLSGADLRGAQITRSRLTKVDLSSADIRGTTLSYIQWLDVNLTDADLFQANLMKSHLRANLYYTDLEEAVLVNTSLRDSWNINPFRTHNALIWNLEMPNGRIDEGPRFEFIE